MRRSPTCIGRARAVSRRSTSAAGRRARGGVVKSRTARLAASAGATADNVRWLALASGSQGEPREDRTIVLFSIARYSASVMVILLSRLAAPAARRGGGRMRGRVPGSSAGVEQGLERAGGPRAGRGGARQAGGVHAGGSGPAADDGEGADGEP